MVAVGDVVVAEEVVAPRHAYVRDVPLKGAKGVLTSLQSGTYSLRGKTGITYYLLDSSKFSKLPDAEAKEIMEGVRKHIGNVASGVNAYNMGTDPEVFAVHGDGKVFPAWEFLPECSSPLKVKMAETSDGWDYAGQASAFWDGFQAEFTVSPSQCHAWLLDYVRLGLNAVWEAARKKDPTAKLVGASVVEIPEEVMQAASKKHAELGCMPSQNIYGEKTHLMGLEAKRLPLRFAGCHIHVGTDKKNAASYVRIMDRIAGVASVSALRDLEDPRRREFYGLAGEYRTPKHGVEWRTLSSAVLVHPALTHLFFDLSRAAACIARDGLTFAWDTTDDETEKVINTYDLNGALDILARNKSLLQRMLDAIYGAGGVVAKNGMRIIMEGAKNHIATDDMEGQWKLGKGWAARGGDDAKWRVHSSSTNCCMQNLKLEK